MARHEDMHDVEMDEREELPTSIVAAAHSRLRRSWPLAAGLVAVLLGGLAITQTVVDARERARLSRVRTVPGVVRELNASVQELWRSDAGESSAVGGGVLLTVGVGFDEVTNAALGLDVGFGVDLLAVGCVVK